MRRSLRIFPLYFGVLFVAFVIVPMLGIQYTTAGMGEAEKNQAWLWLYCSNFGMAWYRLDFGRFSHFCTFAIEEHFYLGWPAIVWFSSASKLHWTCLGVIVGSISCRIGFIAFGDASSAHLLSPCRADSLAMGGLLACATRFSGVSHPQSKQLTQYALWTFGGSLVVFILCAVKVNPVENLSLTLFPCVVSILSASFIVLAVPAQHTASTCLVSKLMDISLLRKFGKYSYAIYVFHVPLIPVVYVVFAKLGLQIGLRIESFPFSVVSLCYFILTAAVCFLISVISWESYEKHFLSLKRFF